MSPKRFTFVDHAEDFLVVAATQQTIDEFLVLVTVDLENVVASLR